MRASKKPSWMRNDSRHRSVEEMQHRLDWQIEDAQQGKTVLSADDWARIMPLVIEYTKALHAVERAERQMMRCIMPLATTQAATQELFDNILLEGYFRFQLVKLLDKFEGVE